LDNLEDNIETQSSTFPTSISSTDSELEFRSLEWQPIESQSVPTSRLKLKSSLQQAIPLPERSTSSQNIKNKRINKSGSSDMLEKSFNVVSESISAIATQMLTNENKNDRDEALATMIITELKNTIEPKKTELRKKLLSVIMEYMSL